MWHLLLPFRRRSPLLREYERYRKLQIGLHTRLTEEYMTEEFLDEAGDFLGLWENIDGKRTIV
jgi:hypothetical protein